MSRISVLVLAALVSAAASIPSYLDYGYDYPTSYSYSSRYYGSPGYYGSYGRGYGYYGSLGYGSYGADYPYYDSLSPYSYGGYSGLGRYRGYYDRGYDGYYRKPYYDRYSYY
ncbi:unnamed protein product [Nezara viridula]|uniref:Neuropeptide n=1 Tax=Nezara viridula TaxID=85310 RepID=A0A9P0HFU9_NEZVI|nr:unnamed protein product [Nezara viridula]